ncbi:MAG: hypothetical protein ACRDWF_01050 [Acidimicrobiia bacterium]
MKRTIGVVRDGLTQYQSKITYHTTYFDPPEPNVLTLLNQRDEETNAMEEAFGIEPPPKVKAGMEA